MRPSSELEAARGLLRLRRTQRQGTGRAYVCVLTQQCSLGLHLVHLVTPDHRVLPVPTTLSLALAHTLQGMCGHRLLAVQLPRETAASLGFVFRARDDASAWGALCARLQSRRGSRGLTAPAAARTYAANPERRR